MGGDPANRMTHIISIPHFAGSESEFKSNLHQPGWLGAKEHSSNRDADRIERVVEVGMIESIEHLPAKLGPIPRLDREDAANRQIHIKVAGPLKDSISSIPEGVLRLDRKSTSVEPAIESSLIRRQVPVPDTIGSFVRAAIAGVVGVGNVEGIPGCEPGSGHHAPHARDIPIAYNLA